MKKFEIEKSKDNYNILKILDGDKCKYIGSKYNQKREIDKLINEVRPFTEKDIYIIFGLSFGEHIKELISKNNFNNKILVIDVLNDWCEYCSAESEISEILKGKNITLGKTVDEVKKFFRENVNDFNIDWVKIGYYGKYDCIFKEELKEILEFIRDEFYLRVSNKNTKIYFSEKWYETLTQNLKYIVNSIPVNRLENKYKNKPAVIVSAGPSLDKNIRELKGKDNLLVFSGGRTIKPLLENNIEPSLLGVVDPGEISYDLVSDYMESLKCPLLFYEGTNERVVKEHKGEKVFYTSNEFIRKVFNERIVDFALGGSIAHALTLFAAYIGCNPIVFIGQDLAYTEDKYHSNSSNRRVHNKLDKGENFFYVDDINGNKVKTSPILNDFRIVLEEIIKLFPETKFINATEGGANIKGTEVKNLKETIKSLNEEIVEFKIDINQNYEVQKNIILELNKSVETFFELKRVSKKGLYLLDELISYYNKNPHKVEKLLKDLDEVDNNIKKYIKELHIVKNLIFSKVHILENDLKFIITELDDKEDRFNKNINKNKAIYNLIYEILDYSEPMLREIISEELIKVEF